MRGLINNLASFIAPQLHLGQDHSHPQKLLPSIITGSISHSSRVNIKTHLSSFLWVNVYSASHTALEYNLGDHPCLLLELRITDMLHILSSWLGMLGCGNFNSIAEKVPKCLDTSTAKSNQ